MLNIVNVDIESIFLDPANARKHGKKNLDSIKGSIKKFGQVEPLVVNKENRVVIGGNGRLVAMKELGFKTVSIVEIDINTVDATALGIALNRTGELAEWDLNNLGPLLKDLDIDLLADIGFDAKDLEKLMPELVKEGLCDEDEVPEVTDTRCKPGDLWQLGNHRLLCGDSTNVQHVERLMGGEKADMVFTDPPYNQSLCGRGFLDKGRESRKKLAASETLNNFNPENLFPILTIIDARSVYVFTSKNLIKDYISHFEKVTDKWNLLVMRKKNPIPQKNNTFLADVEYLFFSRMDGATFNNNLPYDFYRRVQDITVKPSEFGHPTEKKVGLISQYLEISSNQKDIVMDLFLGSGSTLIACEKTNRRCFGLEIDPHYCSVILARWEKFTGQQAKLLST